jgi:LmbE family N-acetylglucosaminyl deacetylase
MAPDLLRLLILGAHPDDAEFHAGGLATIYRQQGHEVKMVSITDGRAGHHRYPGDKLVQVRRREAQDAGSVIGAAYETWGHPDGELQPTLEIRREVICAIRQFAPDLVLTHRPCDYHPDHRAVGQLVQDASYMVTVPGVCPETPILPRDPVVAYMPDLFTRPYPLAGDVVVDITEHLVTITEMLACHVSQVFEFLPFNMGIADQVPEPAAERLAWLRGWYGDIILPRAERFRTELIAQYGPDRGSAIQYVEAYEISEYAAPLTPEARRRLFWFLDG